MAYQRSFIVYVMFCFFTVMLFSLLGFSLCRAETGQVRLGVLAKRGTERAIQQWQPTADYLNKTIPQLKFELVPLPFDQVREAVANQKIDFLLANPAIYVEMEYDYRASRIATMENLRLGKGYTLFGGVIFSSTDQPISKVDQLYGKTFMAVDPTSFGGAITAWRELQENDFNYLNDFGSLTYGKTHDAVVLAVRDGEVDAGTVRSDTIERMAAEGKIDLNEFYILPLWNADEKHFNFPFLHSTRLYPEWPLAKLQHVPEALAKQVSMALLGLESEHPAAKAGKIAGWTIPQNYQSVHECLKTLKIGPYSKPLELTIKELFEQYWLIILCITVMLIMLSGATVYFRFWGQRLKVSERKIKAEHSELDQLFQSTADGIFRVDNDFNIVLCNQTFVSMTGLTEREIIGSKCYDTFPGAACGTSHCPISRIAAGERKVVGNLVKTGKAGNELTYMTFSVPHFDANGDIVGIVESFRDITSIKQAEVELQKNKDALSKAYSELKLNQSQMLQQEKMASIGQLAAGVAHEINNPLGFIGSNLSSLSRYLKKSYEFIGLQENELTNHADNTVLEELAVKRKKLKIDYILEDSNDLIEESLDGVNRVKTIVSNLKSFSRVDQASYDLTDINSLIFLRMTSS